MPFSAILGSSAAKAAGSAGLGSMLSSVGGLGGVGSLLSGVSSLFGKSSDGVSGKQLGAQRVQSAYMSNLAVDQARKMNQAWIDQMYPIQQRQIQDRVADSKAAGVHPLFGLGIQSNNIPALTGGTQSVGIPGQSATGSHARDKLAALGQTLMNFEGQRANIGLTEAQTSYYKALEAKALNDMVAKHENIESTVTTRGTESAPVERGLIEIIPGKNPSRSSIAGTDTAAGSQPAWMRIETSPGKYVEVPYSEDEGWAEGMSNPLVWPLVIKRNMENSIKYLWNKYVK